MRERKKVLGLLRSAKGLEKRFWSKVLKVRGKGCWMWQGYISKSGGYGVMSVGGYPIRTHVVAYFLRRRTLPRLGREIEHTCENRPCARWSHLADVSHAKNMERARRTHCYKGHPYTEENTYRWKGSRCCRTCALTRITERKRAMGVLPRSEWFRKRLSQPRYSKQQKEPFQFYTKPSRRSRFRRRQKG